MYTYVCYTFFLIYVLTLPVGVYQCESHNIVRSSGLYCRYVLAEYLWLSYCTCVVWVLIVFVNCLSDCFDMMSPCGFAVEFVQVSSDVKVLS